jgi:hypothetical protein
MLYGILKPLLLSGLLPDRLARSGDRLQSSASQPGGVVAAAMRVLERIDQPNDDPDISTRTRSFVALSIKARKPA